MIRPAGARLETAVEKLRSSTTDGFNGILLDVKFYLNKVVGFQTSIMHDIICQIGLIVVAEGSDVAL